jgi:hypothetical protein
MASPKGTYSKEEELLAHEGIQCTCFEEIVAHMFR